MAAGRHWLPGRVLIVTATQLILTVMPRDWDSSHHRQADRGLQAHAGVPVVIIVISFTNIVIVNTPS